MDITPFLPGNSSQYGMMSGMGLNPTAAMRMNMSLAEQHGEWLRNWAGQIHPRAQMATMMAGSMMFDNPHDLGAWLKSDEGRGSGAAMGMLAGKGLFGLGSAQDTFFGAQQLMGSGVRMGIGGAPGAQQFYGQGVLTDQFAAQLTSQLASEFYTAGRKNYASRGLDMSDVGSLLNAAAGRGVFAGQEIGGMSVYTSDAQITEDKLAAELRGDSTTAKGLEGAEVGQMRFKLKDEGEKVKKWVQDTGEMLGDLRDIYSGLGVEELLQKAEQITGVGLQQGDPQQMRARITRITSQAKALGLNPEAVLEMTAVAGQAAAGQLSAMYGGPADLYRSIAGTIGTAATPQSMAAGRGADETVANLREKGMFTRVFGSQFREGVALAEITAIMGESPAAAVAFWASERQGIDRDTAGQLRDAVTRYGEAAPGKARRGVESEIDALLGKAGYGGIDRILANHDFNAGDVMARVSPEGQALAVRSFQAQAATRAFGAGGTIMDVMRRQGVVAGGAYGGALGAYSGDINAMSGDIGALLQLGPATIDRIVAEGNNVGGIEAILGEDPTVTRAANIQDPAAFASRIARVGSLGNLMNDVQQDWTSSGLNAGLDTASKRLQAQRAGVVNLMREQSMGAVRIGKPGFLESMVQGLLGVGDGPNEAAVMSYARQMANTGGLVGGALDYLRGETGVGIAAEQTFGIGEGGAMSFDGYDIDELVKAASGGTKEGRKSLFAAMGQVLGDKEGLEKRLRTQTGTQDFMLWSQLGGRAFSHGSLNAEGDSMAFLDATSFDNARKEMEIAGSNRLVNNLGLSGDTRKKVLSDNLIGEDDWVTIAASMIAKKDVERDGKVVVSEGDITEATSARLGNIVFGDDFKSKKTQEALDAFAKAGAVGKTGDALAADLQRQVDVLEKQAETYASGSQEKITAKRQISQGKSMISRLTGEDSGEEMKVATLVVKGNLQVEGTHNVQP